MHYRRGDIGDTEDCDCEGGVEGIELYSIALRELQNIVFCMQHHKIQAGTVVKCFLF